RHPPDASPGAQANHVRGGAEHRADGVERLVTQLDEADIEDPLGVLEKFQISVAIFGAELADLLQRLLDRSAIVEEGAVGELHAIPGVQIDKLHVVFAFLAEELEELVEEKLRGDHGWPHVPGKSVALRDRGAPAELI